MESDSSGVKWKQKKRHKKSIIYYIYKANQADFALSSNRKKHEVVTVLSYNIITTISS